MVRKVTKTKGAFCTEDAIVKQIYLATINANTKWQGPMFGWNTVRNELNQYFKERLNKNDTPYYAYPRLPPTAYRLTKTSS